jgi:hypothetical protein
MQFLETNTVSALWGKTVTFSVLLRRNALFANNLVVVAYKSSTVDAGASATWIDMGGSSLVTNAQLPTATGSSNWYKATVTCTVPQDGTANSIKLLVGQTAVEPVGASYHVAQAQLEIGSIATHFSRSGTTVQGELAACQRYYWQTDSATSYFYSGFTYSSTIFFSQIPYPVTMRTAPSLVTTGSGSDYRILQGGSFIATSAPTLETSQKTVATLRYTGSGYTVGFGGAGSGSSSNAYLGFSSEL